MVVWHIVTFMVWLKCEANLRSSNRNPRLGVHSLHCATSGTWLDLGDILVCLFVVDVANILEHIPNSADLQMRHQKLCTLARHFSLGHFA